MTRPPLELERVVGSDGDTVILRLKGRLSLETVRHFMETAKPEPVVFLVLEMSELSFLDSAGVGALVQVFVHRRKKGHTFALAGLAKQSSAVIQVAGLRKLLPSYASVEEALASKNKGKASASQEGTGGAAAKR